MISQFDAIRKKATVWNIFQSQVDFVQKVRSVVHNWPAQLDQPRGPSNNLLSNFLTTCADRPCPTETSLMLSLTQSFSLIYPFPVFTDTSPQIIPSCPRTEIIRSLISWPLAQTDPVRLKHLLCLLPHSLFHSSIHPFSIVFKDTSPPISSSCPTTLLYIFLHPDVAYSYYLSKVMDTSKIHCQQLY